MRGNVFLCLDNTTFNKLIPNELVGTYGIPEYDEEGVQNGVTHPTFKELGEYNRIKFGHNPMVKIGNAKFYIIQLEASWLNGELSSLLNLGKNKAYPKNSLMTRTEAAKFIQDNDVDNDSNI
jgi:hypothetical protein